MQTTEGAMRLLQSYNTDCPDYDVSSYSAEFLFQFLVQMVPPRGYISPLRERPVGGVRRSPSRPTSKAPRIEKYNEVTFSWAGLFPKLRTKSL